MLFLIVLLSAFGRRDMVAVYLILAEDQWPTRSGPSMALLDHVFPCLNPEKVVSNEWKIKQEERHRQAQVREPVMVRNNLDDEF